MNIIFMISFRHNESLLEQIASTNKPSENDIEEYLKKVFQRFGVSNLKKIDLGKGSNVYDYVLADNSLMEVSFTEMQLITF